MAWSFARARQAVAQVRVVPLEPHAVATMRPRSVLGLVRVRAPGAVLIFVAARDGQPDNRFDEAMTGVMETARVLILVVTPDERDAVLAAVRKHVGRAAVMDQACERTMYSLGSIAGTELMLAQAGEQGTATAAGMLVTAREAIGRCCPDYVILTGICFGLRPEEGQQVGDIVVARRIQDVDRRKVTDDDGRPVIYRGVNVGCSPVLLDRFLAGQPTWRGARVHIGTVLTSNTLVSSERVVGGLREDFPDAIAGEMEGAGVYEAATLDSKPDWIIVKGISDWGYGKTDDVQQRAARNAAEFVAHVIAGGALRRRRHEAAR
jgi:nucleoside phosphorylase